MAPDAQKEIEEILAFLEKKARKYYPSKAFKKENNGHLSDKTHDPS